MSGLIYFTNSIVTLLELRDTGFNSLGNTNTCFVIKMFVVKLNGTPELTYFCETAIVCNFEKCVCLSVSSAKFLQILEKALVTCVIVVG